jgi:hypothetical protein
MQRSARCRQRRRASLGLMAANDLAEALEAAGLAGYAPVLAKARVMSLAELSAHSVAELEESFRRPHVIAKAKDFSFSSKERRGWISLGLLDDGSGSDEEVWRARAPSPSPEPPRPVMSGMVRSVVRSAFGQALPEADLSRLGDLLDEPAVDHVAPRATPPRQPLTRPPTGLFEGATAAAILLGRCEPADLSTDTVRSVLRIVLGAVAKEYDDGDLGSIEEAAVSRESAIDMLDSALVRGCRANLWAAEELEPTRDGVRAATRLASELAFEAAKRRKERALKESPEKGDDFRSLASVLLDQAGGQQLSRLTG